MPPKKMNKIQLSRGWWIVLTFLQIIFFLISFFLGYWKGMEDLKAEDLCVHSEPYEVKTSIDTIMLIVPDGWSGVPLLDEYNKVYRTPSDQRE